MEVTLQEVDADNWREIAALEVTPEQQRFVATPAYYLCLCCYGDLWSPLAVRAEGRTVGFLMWAIDPDDGSCWLGGITVDRRVQGRGYGSGAVRAAIGTLSRAHDVREFALSYEPENERARDLYRRIGFVETGETEGDEVVARYRVPDA